MGNNPKDVLRYLEKEITKNTWDYNNRRWEKSIKLWLLDEGGIRKLDEGSQKIHTFSLRQLSMRDVLYNMMTIAHTAEYIFESCQESKF